MQKEQEGLIYLFGPTWDPQVPPVRKTSEPLEQGTPAAAPTHSSLFHAMAGSRLHKGGFAFHTLFLVWGRKDEKEGFSSKQLHGSSGWLLSPQSDF